MAANSNDIQLTVSSSKHHIVLSDNTRHSYSGSSLKDIILPFDTFSDFPKTGSKSYLYLDKSTGDMYTFGYVDQSYTSVGLASWDIIGGGDSTQKGASDGKNDSPQAVNTL